jgi:hypothetical protein
MADAAAYSLRRKPRSVAFAGSIPATRIVSWSTTFGGVIPCASRSAFTATANASIFFGCHPL